MANWAQLQEELVGLPVVKRAKHGIHFRDGKRDVIANFSGAPCHYQDTDGLWKPLDTKIVELEDGSLGAKGIPVRMNLNGLVRYINSQNEDLYSQVTTRVGVFNSNTMNLVDYINLPVGEVVDDQLVKATDIYTHTITLKETGLREEIVIHEKPAFITDRDNLWLVLDTVVTGVSFEDGWLDQFEIAEMKFPPPTAMDAEGREGTAKRYAKNISGVQHIFTGLKFSELYRAAYPVTIDPDLDISSSAGDTYMNDYYVTRNFGASTSINCSRALLRFDCSSVPSGSTISAGHIHITKQSSVSSDFPITLNYRSVSEANGDWIEGTKNSATAGSGEPCWNAKEADGAGGVTTAWAGSAGMSTAGTDYETTVLASGTYSKGDAVNTQYTHNLNSAGYTRISGWFGAINTNYGLFLLPSNDPIGIYTSEVATASYRPLLSITYSAGGVPKHFLYYARHRSN